MINHPNDKLCKECQKQYQKNRYPDYYNKNKIKILTQIKEKRNNDPITKQKFKKYKQEYNQINKDGDNAFMLACLNGMTEVVEKLMNKRDLNYNQINNDGHTALLMVCKKKRK